MPKENQSDGRAHDCDHEQIFCAHGHIHAHRKSRVIGVLMAMCTSKPIIGKRASWASGGLLDLLVAKLQDSNLLLAPNEGCFVFRISVIKKKSDTSIGILPLD